MNKVISKDGTAIAYDRTGKGPVVIMVGGALSTRSAPQVNTLAELLKPYFTVIGYDRRGRGDSSDTAPYAVQREVEDIEALINASGGSASLYGHSSGAALALEAARRLGSKINKLALYEPPFMSPELGTRLYANHLEKLNEMRKADQRDKMLDYWMAEVTGTPAEYVAQMKNSPMWQELLPVAPTMVYDVTIMDEYANPAERIKGLRIPTLAMDGGASPAWAHEAAQLLVDTIPNAKRRTLEGQTHGADPEVLAPVLVEFFEAKG
jgi:pimeloyl-ACP methyl ester carboxylesterase